MIVAPALPAPVEFIIARKAAVFGDGGGEAADSLTGGVRPVEGISSIRDKLKPKSGGWTEAVMRQ